MTIGRNEIVRIAPGLDAGRCHVAVQMFRGGFGSQSVPDKIVKAEVQEQRAGPSCGEDSSPCLPKESLQGRMSARNQGTSCE